VPEVKPTELEEKVEDITKTLDEVVSKLEATESFKKSIDEISNTIEESK
jgi:hypothetical protein